MVRRPTSEELEQRVKELERKSVAHKRAEEALRESQERYRVLFSSGNDAVLVNQPTAEDMPGKFIEVNDVACRRYGYTREEFLNLTPSDLRAPDRKKDFSPRLKRVREGRANLHETLHVTKEGRIFPVEIHSHYFVLKGHPAVISTIRDITERKRAEEALQRAYDNLEERIKERTKELQQANIKLKELDRLKSMFIASMSHELRTPLNSIIGFTGIILQGMAGEINLEQRDQLQRVYGSAKHLLALINDVIDISKIEAGKFEVDPEEFILVGVIREAVSNLTSEISKKGLGLEISLPQDIQLTTDRKRLLQCILNYLSNAVKFTEKGNIRIAVHEIDGTIEIRIQDTGIGIRSEDIPNLFTSFIRLDSPLKIKTTGNGLGLYFTKKIATDLLEGSVSVESTLGEGSTFSLNIPKILGKGGS